MYHLISDQLRKIAELIELDEKNPPVKKPIEDFDKSNGLPSAPRIKPKRRINPENKVMAPGTIEGKLERKEYQNQYRADGKDINSRYVKKPKLA